MEGFSKTFHPIFLFALKKEKDALKRLESFDAICLASIFEKKKKKKKTNKKKKKKKHTKNLVFIWTLDIYHLLILTISWY